MQSFSRCARLLRYSLVSLTSSGFGMSRLQLHSKPCTRPILSVLLADHSPHGINQVQFHYFSQMRNAQNAEFSVCKFGDLVVETGSLCDIRVMPVNPQLCPDQNRANVDGSVDAHVSCTTADGFSHLKVTNKSEAPKTEQSEECVLEVPIKFNVIAKVAGDRNVSVGSMQNESLHITVATGDCSLTDIHTNCMTVKTSGGNIISKGVQHGDAKLQTRLNGYVSLYKALCQRLEIATEKGHVSVESLFADESTIVTRHGNVDIRNAHRSVNVHCLDIGNVNIQSLDGNLNAQVKHGDVTVYACQHSVIDISVQSGNITLKVPSDSLFSLVDLKGRVVTVDKQLDQTQLSCTETVDCQHVTGLLKQGICGNKTSATITARTSDGNIAVICQDWIASLKLGRNVLVSDDD